ncbi:hypothetical protein B0H14DRAFT_3647368 [Mycena olivaceomarginata]|nr:hypothetical protein B0H14DRAFT_3647368 [Mycena olivaceomarginata]
MLAIAFAILISCIIEATTTNITGQGLTRFHAAVILNLSWMNNTSTWIWFLLYAHRLTKPDPREKKAPNDDEREPVLAMWSAWGLILLSPLRRPTEAKAGSSDTPSGVVQRAWYLVSQKPVLTIGSLHLSLMAAIGLWLWSDPSKFGTPITGCDPSLTVVGGAVPFSTPGLRIFSLAIYSVLVIPGLNLVPPLPLLPRTPYNVQLVSIPKSIIALFRSQHSSAADLESGTQHADPPTTRAGPFAPAESAVKPLKNHTAFLIVGLLCLAIINVILLVDQYIRSRPMANAPKGHPLAAAPRNVTAAAARKTAASSDKSHGRPRRNPPVTKENAEPAALLRKQTTTNLRHAKVKDAAAAQAGAAKATGNVADILVVERPKRAAKAMLNPDGTEIMRPVKRRRGELAGGVQLDRGVDLDAAGEQADAELAHKLDGRKRKAVKEASTAPPRKRGRS